MQPIVRQTRKYKFGTILRYNSQRMALIDTDWDEIRLIVVCQQRMFNQSLSARKQ